MIADDIKLPKKKEPQVRDRVLPPVYDGLSPEMKDKLSKDHDKALADIEAVSGVSDLMRGATAEESALYRYLQSRGKIEYE